MRVSPVRSAGCQPISDNAMACPSCRSCLRVCLDERRSKSKITRCVGIMPVGVDLNLFHLPKIVTARKSNQALLVGWIHRSVNFQHPPEHFKAAFDREAEYLATSRRRPFRFFQWSTRGDTTMLPHTGARRIP